MLRLILKSLFAEAYYFMTDMLFLHTLGLSFNGSLYSLLIRSPKLWSKGCEFESRQERQIFFSPESTLCAVSFGVRFTPVLPQWHVKDPGHPAICTDGGLYLNAHTPLTQRSRNGLTMPLSRHSMETYQETSSHATRQKTFGYSRFSPLSHCGLILV